MTRQSQYQWRGKKKRKRINPRHHQLPQWAVKKKRNGSGRNSNLVDKISSLPNHLLLQILALLPTKTVVQTSILSKTWKNLWRSVDCLQFDGNLFPSITVFINFMNSFLLHRPNSSSSSYDDIEKLSLSYHGFTTDLCLATMDSCLDFAGAKNVKILEISLFHAIPSHLPNVFIFSSLRVLKLITPFVGLGGFPIKLPTSSSVFLPSLKTLHLEGLDFETDHFHSLFSASTCPVLETLYVEDCVMLRYKVMNISFPQLRNLIFLENRTRIVRSIIMSTPNLTSFKFNLDTWCNFFFTHNPPAVSNVQFSAKYIIRTDAAVISPMISFIESVGHHVEFLSLSVYKALFSQLEHGFCLPQYICVPFCNLKWLKLTTTFHACEQLMISTLLNYSPNLESVILENESPDKAPLARKVTKSREQSWSSTTGSILSHLKMVKIHNFQACENGIKFVMFLLDNAVVLERVTIQYDLKCSKHKFEMTKIGKRLQKHPRASSSVRMVFISKPDVDGLHEVLS